MAASQNQFANLIAPTTEDVHAHIRKQFATSAAKKVHPKAMKILRRSLGALKAQDYGQCCTLALKALEIDNDYAQANHILAVALEKIGQHGKAIQFYERALKLDPTDTEIYFNLAHLASKMKMFPTAEKLLRMFNAAEPTRADGLNNLAICLRDQERVDDAIDVLKAAILQMPEDPLMWNTLGSFLIDQGRLSEAHTFIAEALRLDPKFSRAHHNMGFLLSNMGPWDEALASLDKAISLNPPLSERLESEHARAFCFFHMGQLADGFKAWETRHHPRMRTSWRISWNYPQWQGEPLEGKTILLVAEQGLGDEIMFANAIPDIVERVGPSGKVMICVANRLVSLFGRSFPSAIVGPGGSKPIDGFSTRIIPWLPNYAPPDYWAWFGDSLSYLRQNLSDFEPRRAYLKADPEKIDHWKERLQALGPGPYIGLSWKSLVMNINRSRFYSAIDQWKEILSIPNVRFVNLQYGDCADDIKRAEEKFGVTIHQFDDLDLKDDLDGNAALCSALDVVISSPNAASAIAGSVGTNTLFITFGEVWPQLGTNQMPWYRQTRVFNPQTYGDFADALDQAAAHLREEVVKLNANAA